MLLKHLYIITLWICTLQVLHCQYITPSDTAGMGEIMQVKPGDTQLTPQERAASGDSLRKAAYLLQRLKNVIHIKKDILYGQDISSSVQQLQDSSFVLVQPVVSIDARGVMIGLINQVGSLFEGNNTEPWIRLNTKLKPLRDRELPFSLGAELTGSTQIKAEWLALAKAKMDSVYRGKTYQDVDRATDDIAIANLLALRSLRKSVGSSFTPPFVLKLNNTSYWCGRSIPIWQKTGADSTVMLEAQAPDGSMLSGDLDWGNSSLITRTNYDQAWINSRNTGRYEITVTFRDTLKQNFVLNIASSDVKDIIDDFLKKLAQEVVAEIISSGIDDITKNYATLDSVAAGMQALSGELSTDLDYINFGISGNSEDMETVNFDNAQIITSSTKSGVDKISASSSYMFKYNLAQALIKRKALITMLANQAIFEPDEFGKLISNLRDNFVNTVGGLTAELMLRGLEADAKAKVKTALKTYLEKTFEASAQNIEK